MYVAFFFFLVQYLKDIFVRRCIVSEQVAFSNSKRTRPRKKNKCVIEFYGVTEWQTCIFYTLIDLSLHWSSVIWTGLWMQFCFGIIYAVNFSLACCCTFRIIECLATGNDTRSEQFNKWSWFWWRLSFTSLIRGRICLEVSINLYVNCDYEVYDRNLKTNKWIMLVLPKKQDDTKHTFLSTFR